VVPTDELDKEILVELPEQTERVAGVAVKVGVGAAVTFTVCVNGAHPLLASPTVTV
jgi:hypothetical protein